MCIQKHFYKHFGVLTNNTNNLILKIMKNKLFVIDNVFSKFFEKNNTFDFPFDENDVSEILFLNLIAEKIGEEKFLIISDMALSSMHSAEIIKSAIEKNGNKSIQEVIWEMVPPKQEKSPFITWDELIKGKDEEYIKEQNLITFSFWKDKIKKTMKAEDAHIIFFPDPNTTYHFLETMGVGFFTLFAAKEDIGGSYAFPFDSNLKPEEPIDLVSFANSKDGFNGEYNKISSFGLLDAMLGITLLQAKLVFLEKQGYNTENLQKEYLTKIK